MARLHDRASLEIERGTHKGRCVRVAELLLAGAAFFEVPFLELLGEILAMRVLAARKMQRRAEAQHRLDVLNMATQSCARSMRSMPSLYSLPS